MKSQVSRFCFSRPRNCVAAAPSIIRWSQDIDRYTMCRIPIMSSTTTGRFSTASVARIAVSPGFMIGTLISEPNGPGLVMVNVLPCTSSGWSFLFRARVARSLTARAMPTAFMVSAPRTTGTMRP